MRNTIWVLLVVLLAGSTAVAQEATKEKNIDPFRKEAEESYPPRPGEDGYYTENAWFLAPWRVTAPAHFRRNGYLQSLLEIPAMESAGIVDPGHLGVQISSHVAWLSEEFNDPAAPNYFQYEGMLTEQVLDLRYGLFERVEVFVQGIVGNLQEENGDEPIELRLGGVTQTPVGDRDADLSDVVFGTKILIREFPYANRPSVNMPVRLGLAVHAQVKVPLADEENFLTSGAKDGSVMLVLTDQWGPFIMHFNGGVHASEKFEDFFLEDVDPDTVGFVGGSIVYPFNEDGALFAQIQASTSAFQDIDLLDDELDHPAKIGVGGRRYFDGFYIDLGVSFGISNASERSSGYVSVAFEY